jgi:hypothetical protein
MFKQMHVDTQHFDPPKNTERTKELKGGGGGYEPEQRALNLPKKKSEFGVLIKKSICMYQLYE